MTNNGPIPTDGPGIEDELRELGRHLAVPEPAADTVSAVMARIAREPVSSRAMRRAGAIGWLRNRWRAAGVVVVGALLVLVAVTPAGAAIREWFGFGAVVVEQDPVEPPVDAGSSASPGAPGDPTDAGADPEGTQMSLAQARATVSYPVALPTALGPPERVTVSPDGRLVTLQWSGVAGPIRLDQIGGSLSPYYVKKYYQDVTFTTVDNDEALWFARSHPIVVLDPDGTERVRSERRSGPTLLWQRDGVTLRLEGVNDQQSAVAIAESLPD